MRQVAAERRPILRLCAPEKKNERFGTKSCCLARQRMYLNLAYVAIPRFPTWNLSDNMERNHHEITSRDHRFCHERWRFQTFPSYSMPTDIIVRRYDSRRTRTDTRKVVDDHNAQENAWLMTPAAPSVPASSGNALFCRLYASDCYCEVEPGEKATLN